MKVIKLMSFMKHSMYSIYSLCIFFEQLSLPSSIPSASNGSCQQSTRIPLMGVPPLNVFCVGEGVNIHKNILSRSLDFGYDSDYHRVQDHQPPCKQALIENTEGKVGKKLLLNNIFQSQVGKTWIHLS